MLRLVGIGALGNMLNPAAYHLSQGNHPEHFVRIYDRNPNNKNRQQRRDAWQVHGAELVHTYEELIRDDTDGVVICAGKNGDDLAIIKDVIKLITQEYPINNRPFILHLSTVSIRFVEAVTEACHERAIDYVNYPLTGGQKGAEAASMLILASGNSLLYKRLQPFLAKLGHPKYFGTEVAAAAKIKLIGHLLVFNGLMGITSAVNLQTKSLHETELTTSAVFDFLNQGAGGTRQWDVAMKQAITSQDWQSGFMLPHALIDAIYTIDFLIANHMPAISIYSILYLASAFNYLIENYEPNLATQSLLKAFENKKEELDDYVASLFHPQPKKFLLNILAALSLDLQRRVYLDISSASFIGA